MKKCLVFFLGLFILATAGLGWCIKTIQNQQDQIVITEETILGDIRAADGLTVKIDTQWENDKIRWDTTVTIDGDTAQPLSITTESELRYHEENLQPRNGAYLLNRNTEILRLSYDDGVHYGYAGNTDLLDTIKGEGILSNMKHHRLGSALAKIAWEAKADSVYTKEVRLADYLSYYPLFMDMWSDVSYVWYGDEWNIGDYLRVRIPEDHMMSVSITKNIHGTVTQVSAESTSGSVEIKTPAAMTDRSVFYAVYAVNRDDGAIRSLEMEHGNGIYCLPFVEEEDTRNMKPRAMKNIFSLEEKVCLVGLAADTSGDVLYLVVKEEGLLKLKMIALDYRNAAPGEVPVAQEIGEWMLIGYPDQSEVFLIDQIESHLLIVLNDGTLVFLPESLHSEKKEIIRGKVSTDSMAYAGSRMWDYSLDYEDGKLALICAESYWDCSARVYVFDHEGEQYQGILHHSLDYQGAYRDYTLQLEQPLEISWSGERIIQENRID